MTSNSCIHKKEKVVKPTPFLFNSYISTSTCTSTSPSSSPSPKSIKFARPPLPAYLGNSRSNSFNTGKFYRSKSISTHSNQYPDTIAWNLNMGHSRKNSTSTTAVLNGSPTVYESSRKHKSISSSVSSIFSYSSSSSSSSSSSKPHRHSHTPIHSHQTDMRKHNYQDQAHSNRLRLSGHTQHNRNNSVQLNDSNTSLINCISDKIHNPKPSFFAPSPSYSSFSSSPSAAFFNSKSSSHSRSSSRSTLNSQMKSKSKRNKNTYFIDTDEGESEYDENYEDDEISYQYAQQQVDKEQEEEQEQEEEEQEEEEDINAFSESYEQTFDIDVGEYKFDVVNTHEDDSDDYIIQTPKNLKTRGVAAQGSTIKRVTSVISNISLPFTGGDYEDVVGAQDNHLVATRSADFNSASDCTNNTINDEDYTFMDDTISCVNTPVLKDDNDQVLLHPVESPFNSTSPRSVTQEEKQMLQSETVKDKKTPFYHLNHAHSLQKKKTYHYKNKLYRSSSLKRYNSHNAGNSVSNSTSAVNTNTNTDALDVNMNKNKSTLSVFTDKNYKQSAPFKRSDSLSGSRFEDPQSSSSLNLGTIFSGNSAPKNMKNASASVNSSSSRVCELVRSNSQLRRKPQTPCVTPLTASFNNPNLTMSNLTNSSLVSTPASADRYTPVTPEKNSLLYKINTDNSFEISSTTSFMKSGYATESNKETNVNSNGAANSTQFGDFPTYSSSVSLAPDNANPNIGGESEAMTTGKLLDDTHREFCPNGIPYITCEEFEDVFKKNHQNMIVVDCRFEEEYNAGHIINSTNIDDHINLKNFFFTNNTSANSFFQKTGHSEAQNEGPNLGSTLQKSNETLVVLYCEYTKYRSPTLAQFIRRFDRNLNLEYYPDLYYPNLYILKGGFYEFHNKFPQLCIGSYKPMLESEKHEDKMDYFRSKTEFLLNSAQSSEIMLDMKLQCVKTMEQDENQKESSFYERNEALSSTLIAGKNPFNHNMKRNTSDFYSCLEIDTAHLDVQDTIL
ncbi:hypothetical protein ACO0QE_001988 [Hanseniaspora vineae]